MSENVNPEQVGQQVEQAVEPQATAFMPQGAATPAEEPAVVVTESKLSWWRSKPAMIGAGVAVVAASFGLGYATNEVMDSDTSTVQSGGFGQGSPGGMSQDGTDSDGQMQAPGGMGQDGQSQDGSGMQQGPGGMGQNGQSQDGQSSDGAGTLQQPGQEDSSDSDTSDDADNTSSNT